MPRLVRTLEQILREERKDVYFVQFSDAYQMSLAAQAESPRVSRRLVGLS